MTFSPARQLQDYKNLINFILDILYRDEVVLLEKDLCERSLVFRFAYHLQRYFEPHEYYVDCDYNSSYFFDEGSGQRRGQKGKPIHNLETGEITGRYVDIIVHKRLLPQEGQDSTFNDLICFECKKLNNQKRNGLEKDRNNLKVLTTNYGYQYGFHIFFGSKRDNCQIYIYQEGNLIHA